ncbi:hypothetical protein PENPOL_c011G04767 [Penicillium polonicum]|uniref:Integrase catalytic domain-containing protein n=1 Tax=Penicillium polonicum TaxID=60169 RepID=A0A1V6NDL3_PENPO|nr:hypothetical protein PENPOL_c011G04767 [Penicillium polonicum]
MTTVNKAPKPEIARLDGAQFNTFRDWGTKRGMTFEVTPPYTAEPNGAVERYGGYINDIQRTMIIDISLPDKEKLWPFAVEAAIYTTDRLVNPKTGISSLTHWRQELNIETLNRL